MDDENIIKLIQMRNPDGLEELIKKYKRLSCSIAMAMLKNNEEDSLECVNDAFYDLWKSSDKFDIKKSSLKGWVAVITHRRAIDIIRKNSRIKNTSFYDFPEGTFASDDNIENNLSRHEKAEMLKSFVNTLSETDYTIFIKRFFMLESINTISENIDMSRASVDNRLSRIRKALKEYMERSRVNNG